MTYKSQLGKLGENLIYKYLINNGYKIIECNFRKPWGELDIITKAPDKTLVFIEVKATIKNSSGIKPEDQLTYLKLKKLKRTASLYANHRQDLIKENKGWRIDLITIILKESNLLTIKEGNCFIRHYKNIS